MTLRFPLLLLTLAISPLLLADQAHLNAKVTVSDSTIHTGEWFTVTGTVKNEGPDDARDVYAFTAFIYQPFLSDVVASGDWICNRFGETSGLSGDGWQCVQIEPGTPGLRYWCFVSVTDNDTQHVTTITPQ